MYQKMKFELKQHHELPKGWWKYPNTLTGYRVHLSYKSSILSIFDSRHNEFWMIWSDIMPMFMFTYVYMWYIYSNIYKELNTFYKVTSSSIYIAVIVTRLCSSIYHIFNSMSLRSNNMLINFDLIGICQGALGSPWFMANLLQIDTFNNDYFLSYVSLLFTFYIICVFIFGYLLISTDKHEILDRLAINMLLFLALIGNTPLIIIGLNNRFPLMFRILCLTGTGSLGLGYIIYTKNIPEVFMRPGIADGKIWNSHVIWHTFVTIAQMCFICCILAPKNEYII